MNYAIGVGVYVFFYLLGTVLPLLLLDGTSVIRVVIESIPILLVAPRILQRLSDKEPLLPEGYRHQAGFLLGFGQILIFIGHLVFFGAIGATFYFAAIGAGVPVGILAGYAFIPYLLGVEISFRLWSRRMPEQLWKRKRIRVWIAVGIIVLAHLVFVLRDVSSSGGVDLLSYYEREALAIGRGYAREVHRRAAEIYVDEGRVPCSDDLDAYVDSLLQGGSRTEDRLWITLLECGEFAVTIRHPIDGVAEGALFYSASPGDADAGRPLEWTCVSGDYRRIERHTRGECTYDASYADRLPEPVTWEPAPRDTPPRRPVERPERMAEPSAPPVETTAPAPRAPRPDAGSPASRLLERLGEPVMWETCTEDALAFRLLRFETSTVELAAVRIELVDPTRRYTAGTYRTVTSSAPDRTIAMDGNVDMRDIALIEGSFLSADFWNLRSQPESDSRAGRVQIDACARGLYHSVQRPADDPVIAELAEVIARYGKLR